MKPLYSRLLVLAFTLLTNVVFAQVNAAFTNSTPTGCSPLVVSFTDQSTNATQWRWDFGNGNTSVQKNPSAAYLAPGTYTVRLIAINGGTRDTLIKTQHITVFKSPVANFAVSDTVGCIPKTVSFTDLSVPGDAAITSWLWDFGDGSTSTQQNPTHTYTSAGINSIVLITRDANGCTGRFSVDNLIAISPMPVANFTSGPRTNCSAPFDVSFSSTSTGTNLSYSWDFGDGGTSTLANPVYAYNTPGTYNVSLTVSKPGGCSHTVTRNSWVTIAGFNSDFTVDNAGGCISDTFNFTDQSGPAANMWSWDFGDGSTSTSPNPSHTYTTGGTYTVTLISGNAAGCRDTLVQTAYINVAPAPVVSFVADSSNNCELPFTVNFINSSLYGSTYFWDFGDSTFSTDENPSHTYTVAGNYNVLLTVRSAGGCSTTAPIADSIRIIPTTAAFGAENRQGCVPITVNFEDLSTSPDSIVSWEWDLGDGTTSTDRNPTHDYTVPGRYDVTLVVTSTRGCKDTLLADDFVRAGDPPVVEFEADRFFSCLYLPLNFQDLSNTGDEWLWEFGDGGTSTLQDPAYVYGDTGIFTVSLIVGHNGCFDTLEKPNYIQIFPPAARFDPIQSCTTPYTVNFVNNSLGGHIWVWSFGDGDSSWDRHPTHTYTSRGSYSVRLYVEDTIGHCFHDQTTSIAITDPIASFAGDKEGCEPFATTYFPTGIDARNHLWEFEDGHTFYRDVLDTTPVRDTILTAGIYPLTITIRDINGCVDTRPDTITVFKSTAYFGADTFTGCIPLTVNYADSSTSYLGNVTAWNWDLGNGDTSTLPNPSSTYSTPGNYNITLTVTDDNGCESTLNRVNFIYPTYPAPGFNASITDICLGQPAVFNNTSAGTGLNYTWDFGDGNTSTDVNPHHTYADTGEYTITLIASDINGCDSTTVRTDYIRVVQPHANFSVDTTFANCPPLQVTFTDLSHDSITGWAYHFGDNQVSSAQNPTHIYNRPGVFYPYLVATNYAGCNDTMYLADSIVVLGPYGTFDFVQTTTCVPFDITFIANNTNSVSTNIWDLADGSVDIAGDTITHTYTLAGVYNPVLILRDSLGCTISIPTPRPIVATDIDADFSPSIAFHCRGGNVTFNDLSTSNPGVGSWLWTFGDGTTSTAQNPVHNYTGPGIYTVKLIATNTSGCQDSMIHTDMVTIAPAPNASFTASTTATCFPNGVSFTDNSTSDSAIISRNWNFGDGATAAGLTASHTYAAPGTYNVSLIINTASGCPDTAIVPVTIHALPVTGAGTDVAICYGTSTQLNATGGTSYQWSPAAGLSATNISNPVASPTVTTTYVVLATNANGCQDTDTVTVTVNDLPIADMSADTTICYGQSAELSADGGISYTWSGTGLSSYTSSNPVASPLVSTTYSVTITDVNGCTASGTSTVNINSLPIPVLSNDTTVCPGGSAQLSVAGGASYQWSPSAGLNSTAVVNPVSTPQSATTYVVTITDTNGCVNSDSVSVNIHALPVIGISPDVAICIGSATQVTATGGVSYTWTPASHIDNALIANPTVSPTATATYNVVITDANTCQQDTSVVIRVNPLPVPVLSADTAICIGESAQLTATGGASYAWTGSGLDNHNIDSPVATPLATTTYSVLVTDSNGCVNTDSLTITINPLPVVITSNDTAICIGETANLSAAGGGSYAWSPAAGLSNANIANPTANPTVTTTYTVQVINANGCINTANVTVTINALPIPTITPGDTAFCENRNVQLMATGGVTYHWTPGTYITNVNVANPFVYPVNTTTYRVMVTDANGCRKDTSVTITVRPLPIPVVTTDTAICNGSSITLSASGGDTYQWTPSTGLSCTTCSNPVANPDTTTRYVVRLTSAYGCSVNDTVIVRVNDISNDLTLSDTTGCIPMIVSFTSITSGNGTISNAWNFGDNTTSAQNNPQHTYNAAGNYTVQLVSTSSFGCTDTATASVTINPLPQINGSADVSICLNDSTVLTASGGVTYQWSPVSGLNDASTANPSASPASTTSYVVTVTDTNGCMNYDTTTVTVNSLPAPAITGTAAICAGDSAQLTATRGNTYTWTPVTGLNDANIPTPMASPDSTTQYTVTVTDSNGCSNTADFTLTVNPLPIAQLSGDTTICIGQTATLEALGADSYLWTPATGLDCDTCSLVTASPDSTTTYIVEFTSAQGCQVYDTVTVTINALPVVNATADTAICAGQSLQLTASGGGTYLWTPATGLDCDTCANPVASPAINTTYIVAVTSVAGCYAEDTVIIGVHQLNAEFVQSDSAVCSPAPVKFNDASTSDSTITSWNWSFGDASTGTDQNPTHNYTTVGAFDAQLIITNSAGCSDTVVHPVILMQPPVAGAGADTAICLGSAVTLTGSGIGTYTWNNGNTLDDSTSINPVATPARTTLYILTIAAANGCVSTDTVTVTVNALPIATASGDNSGCEGDALQLQATGGVSYTWSPATALNNANIANPVMRADSSRTYTVIITDANGCQATDSIAITVTPMPVTIIKAITDICVGDTLTLTSGGGTTYQWSPATGLSCTTCEAPVAQPLENITYTVTASNGNCSATASHTVTVHALPVVDAFEGSTVCRGTDITLTTTSTGAVSHAWTPAATLNDATLQSPVASPTADTWYTVTALNSLGCSAKDSVEIKVLSDVTVTLSSDTSICPGTAALLRADITSLTGVPGTVEWLPANLFNYGASPIQLVRPDATTQYQVVAHSSTCAPDTQTITVTVLPQPDVDAGYNQSVMQNQQVSLTANSTASIVSYSWAPGDSLDCTTCPEVSFNAGMSKPYTVLVIDENGCMASDTVLVRIITSCEEEVFVPNMFSPNNDGANDVLFVRGQSLKVIETFRVFDRWGNLVFETNDITKGWDGTYRGSMLNDGVFVYYVEGTCTDGAVIAKKGNVTLLR